MKYSAPYAASWLDRLTDGIERLPGPPWLYYSAVLSLLFATGLILQWRAGQPLVFSGLIMHAALGAYNIGLMHYLDRRAAVAFKSFQPALKGGEEERRRLLYQLTSLPRGNALLFSIGSTLFVVVTYLLLPVDTLLEALDFPSGSASKVYVLATSVVTWWAAGGLVNHTIHQLRTVNQIYTEHTRIDLFRLSPFSPCPGSRAALGLGSTSSRRLWH